MPTRSLKHVAVSCLRVPIKSSFCYVSAKFSSLFSVYISIMQKRLSVRKEIKNHILAGYFYKCSVSIHATHIFSSNNVSAHIIFPQAFKNLFEVLVILKLRLWMQCRADPRRLYRICNLALVYGSKHLYSFEMPSFHADPNTHSKCTNYVSPIGYVGMLRHCICKVR